MGLVLSADLPPLTAERDDGPPPETMSAHDIGARADGPLVLLRHDRDEVLSAGL